MTTDSVTEDSPAAQILAGDDMVIETGTLTNNYSQITANDDIRITANTATNVGLDLIETTVITTVTKTWEEFCNGWSILGWCSDWDWRSNSSTSTSTSSATVDAVYGTIEANGTLTATVTGYLDNDAVRGGAGQIGLSSGDRVLVLPDGVLALPALDARIAALLEHSALFRFDPSPERCRAVSASISSLRTLPGSNRRPSEGLRLLPVDRPGGLRASGDFRIGGRAKCSGGKWQRKAELIRTPPTWGRLRRCRHSSQHSFRSPG